MSTDKQKRMRIYFTGVGGQGTLTATTLLARTALDAGLEVVAGEVHGMAQRGGVVESVLLLGGWRSPKLDLGEADVLLGFEPLETLRGLPYLRAGGAVFSSADPLPPLSVSLGGARYPSPEEVEAQTRRVAGQCQFVPCREWKNVESPMKATTVLPEARAKPLPAEMDDPMQTRKSAHLRGGSMPSV